MARMRGSQVLSLLRGTVRQFGAHQGAQGLCQDLGQGRISRSPWIAARGQSCWHRAGAVDGSPSRPGPLPCSPHRGFSAAADVALAEASPAAADTALQLPDSSLDSMTPSAVVEMLDRYIVGQQDAKRAVAVALRNRWRRQRIPEELRTEVVPKNILMIGPTGCGKTEIARRLAKLADAPFVKVEATKFTEVGFHGRDVDQIIRDLTDNAIIHMRSRMKRKMASEIATAVEDKLLDLLLGDTSAPDSKDDRTREDFRELLKKGSLDDRSVAMEPGATKIAVGGAEALGGVSQQDFVSLNKVLAGITKGKESKKKMTVKEARPLIEEGEMDRLVNSETLAKEAIAAVESDGIVFIDEIDKIVTSSENRYGADASSEGVQRDLLPIIEGSTVSTKHGNVNTDFILFICSGAFHSSKPSDMMAELQGRLPIRVELKGLNAKDFYRILTEPATNMIRQQMALLATEGLELEFKDEAIQRISEIAEEVNRSLDNIGARRLHTILEKILEDVSFRAPELVAEAKAKDGPAVKVIEKADVDKAVGELVKRVDLSKYVL